MRIRGIFRTQIYAVIALAGSIVLFAGLGKNDQFVIAVIMQFIMCVSIKCSCCGSEMELWRILHPKYGDIYYIGRDAPEIKA